MGGVGGGSRALLASLLGRVSAQRVPLLDTNRASTTPLQRLVRSLTTSEAANEKISPAAAASMERTEAGTSDQTEPSKRAVRGGPVSWLSLVLLMITGSGLIFYYDKEKKRHIEGILLWYLMNPKMEFVKFYGKNYNVDTLAEGIIKEIKGHN